jgi:hypothetical protein
MRVSPNAKVDKLSSASATIENPHHKIHDGVMYEIYLYDATLANSASINISTPNPIGATAHFTFDGGCGGDALLELLEGATVTGGDAATAHNMNRNYDDSSVSVVTDTTLGGTPTTLVAIFLPGGQRQQAAGASGGSREGLEWVTDPTKSYAVRLTNLSGAEKPASIAVNFYT